MLVQDVFIAAMEIIGATTLDELPEPSEMQKCLRHCNLMLDSWSSRLMLQATIQESFPLVANKPTYTIGLGADFNTAKPIAIPSAFVRDASGVDYPVQMVDRETYDNLDDKMITAGRPDTLLYDPGVAQQSVQTGRLISYPSPDAASTYTLFINSLKNLTEFVNLTDVVTMMPATLDCLVQNLACKIWRPMGRKGPVPIDIERAAARAMTVVMRVNHTVPQMRTDLPGAGEPDNNPLSGGWI